MLELECSFKRTPFRDSNCFIEINIKRKKFKYCGIFVDLLGKQQNEVIKVLCNELITSIKYFTERAVFYLMPEETPVLDIHSADHTVHHTIEAKINNFKEEGIRESEKRGTFILDSLKNFLKKEGDKLIFVIAQNPVWDIKLGMEILSMERIPLSIIRIPQEENLRERIVPRRINENIITFDGDNECYSERIKERLGIKDRIIKFNFSGAKILEHFKENYKSVITEITEKQKLIIEIKSSENEKRLYITLTEILDDASISIEERTKILDKKIKEIQEDFGLEKSIKLWKEQFSEIWEGLFDRLKDFNSKDYEFNCTSSTCNEKMIGFICYRCKKLNPNFEEEVSEIIKAHKPIYILLFKSGLQLKYDFITDEDTTSDKEYQIPRARIRFHPAFWSIQSPPKNLRVMNLKTKKEMKRSELGNISRNVGNVYKIMIDEDMVGLVIVSD